MEKRLDACKKGLILWQVLWCYEIRPPEKKCGFIDDNGELLSHPRPGNWHSRETLRKPRPQRMTHQEVSLCYIKQQQEITDQNKPSDLLIWVENHRFWGLWIQRPVCFHWWSYQFPKTPTWGLEIDCQPTCGGCSARLEPVDVLELWKVSYHFSLTKSEESWK